jgi:hypothetical protein
MLGVNQKIKYSRPWIAYVIVPLSESSHGQENLNMHPCLLLEDIPPLIFEHLYENSGTLASLARTCQDFSG